MGGTVGYVMGNDDGDFNRGQSAGILAAAMAGIGIIVGPVVGAASPGHQWTRVEVPARIGIVPIGPRSVGITVSMRPF
jgi:hypothetical protein